MTLRYLTLPEAAVQEQGRTAWTAPQKRPAVVRPGTHAQIWPCSAAAEQTGGGAAPCAASHPSLARPRAPLLPPRPPARCLCIVDLSALACFTSTAAPHRCHSILAVTVSSLPPPLTGHGVWKDLAANSLQPALVELGCSSPLASRDMLVSK